MQFRVLDINLRLKKDLNPIKKMREAIQQQDRESISGVNLPKIDAKRFQPGKMRQTFEISGSVGFKKKPKIHTARDTSEKDQIIENIKHKIEGDKITNTKVGPNVGEEIFRFENANLFD